MVLRISIRMTCCTTRFTKKTSIGLAKRLATHSGRLVSPSPIYAGLFVSAIPPAELETAISIANASGGSGISLFDDGALRDEHWEVLLKTLT